MKTRTLENKAKELIEKAIVVAKDKGYGPLINTSLLRIELDTIKSKGDLINGKSKFATSDERILSAFFGIVEILYSLDWGDYYNDDTVDDGQWWEILCYGYELLGRINPLPLEKYNDEIELTLKKLRSEQSKKAAKAKDIKQGYSANREKIRELWASGKYSSRSICAEQECAALGMSYDAARKALINTPDPA